VTDWLELIGFSQYEAAFRDSGFEELPVIAYLDEDDLDLMDITDEDDRQQLMEEAFIVRCLLEQKEDQKTDSEEGAETTQKLKEKMSTRKSRVKAPPRSFLEGDVTSSVGVGGGHSLAENLTKEAQRRYITSHGKRSKKPEKDDWTAQAGRYVTTNFSRKEKKQVVENLAIPGAKNVIKTSRVGSDLKIGEYTLFADKKLGSGGGGSVYVGQHNETKEKVAIKIAKKSKLAEREYNLMSILGKIHHKHCIELKQIVETDNEIFIVMSFAEGGDLFDYITSHEDSRLPTEEALRLFKQLVSAVNHLHKNGFVHRDIKPENVFLDNDKNVLLGDFGFCSVWSSLKPRHKSCGTLEYSSPEVVGNTAYSGPEVDMWSLGVVLYIMLVGQFPFDGDDDDEVRENIKHGVWDVPDFGVDEMALKLVDRLLEPDNLKRATMMDVLNCEWFTGNKDGI